ncbi:MAG: hypothetical protein LBU84_06210 [Prevotella sp.]|jgi:hypothetical protein|nr:hypothetical protein [Prevotella sp.]
MTDKDKKEHNSMLDNRLGTPMKKAEGLSSDMKKAESEHLHAFRNDVNINNKKISYRIMVLFRLLNSTIIRI